MRITFLGAARTVTGSCYLVETNQSKVLVDCGMFQGSKLLTSFNRRDFLFNPADIDAVVLTHAHVDHSGLLPKLVKDGFKNKIYSTKATRELCSIMLPDSAHIQESDAEFSNRKGTRAGKPHVTPIYSIDDAYATLKHFEDISFYAIKEISSDIKVRYVLAGHILGAAVLEMWVTEDGVTKKILFSGDLGRKNQPITKDPDQIPEADYILVESTYGDRTHLEYDKEEELSKIINDTYTRGGNLIIPAFAVGRTQTLLYYIQKLIHEKRIPEDIQVIIDSPLAVKATTITLDSPQEFDAEASIMYENQGHHLINIPNLRLVESAAESRLLNGIDQPSIILSASGMAEAGRVLHHLKHNLWRPDCSVMFVGFQAPGSFGRLLTDGAKMVKIMGERITVKAKIYNLQGFSAHADKTEILEWLHGLHHKPQAIFVVHGEPDVSDHFSKEISKQMGVATYVPQYGDIATITADGWQVAESETIVQVPAITQLREELRILEKNYFYYRMRLEQVVNKDQNKLKDISKRLNKIKAYMDDNLSDLR